MVKNLEVIKFIDLFAGIGGIRIAFENVGAKCIYSSEIEPNCRQTYFENFGEEPHGDITQIDPKNIPDHNILCGGFPCQPFSISGKQKGFLDTRGTLFFNIMEIVKAKKPEIVFLENVKNLSKHDSGNTLKVIIKALDDEGYSVKVKVLNAKDYGVPQNRERTIIVASRIGEFDFSKVELAPKKPVIKDILSQSEKFEYLKPEEYTILDKKYWKTQISGLIFCGYRNKKIRTNGVRPNTEHLSRVHKQPNRIYYYEGTHPTIPSQELSGRFWIYDGKRVRKLTINECFRLMGFPEEFKKISSTPHLYKQIGNSVAIPMIQAVSSQIMLQYFPYLYEEEKINLFKNPQLCMMNMLEN